MKKTAPKELDLFVTGMHCASCEVLIEKKLLKNEAVKAVDASLSEGKVRLLLQGDMDLEDINRQFQTEQYIFSKAKVRLNNEPFIRFKNGSVRINKTKAGSLLKMLALVTIFLAVFFIIEQFHLGQYISVDNNSALSAFFLLGLAAGISSCAALVGGLLLSMSKSWHETYIAEESVSLKARPHLMFHIGRIVSFVVLGGVLGSLGGLITLDNPVIYSLLVMTVSLLMALLALQMLGIGWAKRFKLRAPKFLLRYATDENNFKGRYLPFVTGALTFFLPCGFTLIAQALALSSGSFLQGSMIMLAFVLGTLPALAIVSLSSLKFTSRPHLTARFNIVAGVLVLFFVVYNINGQMNVLGLPSLSDIQIDMPVQQIAQEEVQYEGNVQIISLIAQGFEYLPTNGVTFMAGVPTKLRVENKGIAGCGAYLAATGLVDGYLQLKLGINEIEIEDPKPGTYKITCTMGMVPPVTIKII